MTVEGEPALLEEAPTPAVIPDPADLGCTIAAMPGAPVKPASATPARIEIPRWMQLVGLPLMLVLIWVVAGAVRHVVFLFLVALLIALLLNPLVRGLGRVWIPRGLAVAIHQTGAEQDLTRLQHWLNGHHLKRIRVEKQGTKVLNSIGTKDVQKYTAKALTWAEGAGLAVVGLLFSVVLVIVVSVYMLLDMHRLAAAVDRRFPPYPGSTPLIERMERALASYVKGQLLLSLIIGASAGIGLWALGMVGLMPNGGRYALIFGVWAGVTELIPYIGPWLGAAPPVVYAIVQHPLSALWVALLFLGIQQLEGHVVVPKVMGHSLRLHPLLVIFGLLAGGEIYGFPGILVALPLLAAGRAAWEFFGERVELARWTAEQPVAEAGVDLAPAAPERPAASASQ